MPANRFNLNHFRLAVCSSGTIDSRPGGYTGGIATGIAAYPDEQSFADDPNPPQVLVGTIVTGDSFIADQQRIKWIQREFGAIAAEMEGAAVGQVCQANKIPFAIVRVISDSASGGAAGEFIMFLDEASERSYRIIETVLPMLNTARQPQFV